MRRSPVVAYRDLIADVYELAGRSRATSDQFASRYGQTAARWHILSVVSDGTHTVPRIAERLGLTRQSVQRVVDELVVDRLLVLTDNPNHRRSRLVKITSTGEKVTIRMFEESSEYRSSALAREGVSVSELDQARRTIRRLIGVVDEPATELTGSVSLR